MRWCKWIGICDGNMQEGSFRCDANVSVRPLGEAKLGTRAEIKNLNSFRFLEQAIEFEIRRQIEWIEDGRTVVQETRLYDPDRHETRSMRSKEDAQDYRYFPDPDLPPLAIDEAWITRVGTELPELPEVMKSRFEAQYGLTAYDAARADRDTGARRVFRGDRRNAARRREAGGELGAGRAPGRAQQGGSGRLRLAGFAAALAQLLQRLADGTISGKIAKDVFEALWAGDGDADTIIAQRGLKQISDEGTIERIVDAVIAANPAIVAEYKAGREKAFNSLVGKAMQATKGKANPAQVNAVLKKRLGA